MSPEAKERHPIGRREFLIGLGVLAGLGFAWNNKDVINFINKLFHNIGQTYVPGPEEVIVNPIQTKIAQALPPTTTPAPIPRTNTNKPAPTPTLSPDQIWQQQNETLKNKSPEQIFSTISGLLLNDHALPNFRKSDVFAADTLNRGKTKTYTWNDIQINFSNKTKSNLNLPLLVTNGVIPEFLFGQNNSQLDHVLQFDLQESSTYPPFELLDYSNINLTRWTIDVNADLSINIVSAWINQWLMINLTDIPGRDRNFIKMICQDMAASLALVFDSAAQQIAFEEMVNGQRVNLGYKYLAENATKVANENKHYFFTLSEAEYNQWLDKFRKAQLTLMDLRKGLKAFFS